MSGSLEVGDFPLPSGQRVRASSTLQLVYQPKASLCRSYVFAFSLPCQRTVYNLLCLRSSCRPCDFYVLTHDGLLAFRSRGDYIQTVRRKSRAVDPDKPSDTPTTMHAPGVEEHHQEMGSPNGLQPTRQRMGSQALADLGEASATTDPFVTEPSAAHRVPHHYSSYDGDWFPVNSSESPVQVRRALEAHLADTNRRIEDASRLGTALLKQREELCSRLEDVDETQAQQSISPELQRRLAELEKEYNEVGGEAARNFVPKSRMMSNDSQSPAKILASSNGGQISPSKSGMPSRKARNQPSSRVHDIEFATEISTSLLAQVRHLQTVLAEKDEALKVVNLEKSELEAETEGFHQRFRSLDESEQRFKDESWNLETKLQSLQATLKESADRETRLMQGLATAQADKDMVHKELEEATSIHNMSIEEHTMVRRQQELEMSTLKRELAADEHERGALQKRIDELVLQNQELARAIACRLRDQNNGKQDDTFQRYDDLERADSDAEQSPPPSPVKGTPRHGGLESETLRSSLHHAHRMIQNLKNNIHREKTEKIELRRMLQEARDEIEIRRNEGAGRISNAKTRKTDTKHDAFKKPTRPNRLGGMRTGQIEAVLDEPDWEDHDGIRSPSKTKANSSISSGRQLENANESDAFETANEQTATETEAFHTGAESMADDSSDGLTETEDRRSERVGIASMHTTRSQQQPIRPIPTYPNQSPLSTASTSADEADERDEVRTPLQVTHPKYRLKIGRGGQRWPQRSGSETYRNLDSIGSRGSVAHDSPASLISSGSTRNANQSLFAELRELDGDSDDASTTLEGTPSRSKLGSPVASLPSVRKPSVIGASRATQDRTRPEMVDAGVMTEPWEPANRSRASTLDGPDHLSSADFQDSTALEIMEAQQAVAIVSKPDLVSIEAPPPPPLSRSSPSTATTSTDESYDLRPKSTDTSDVNVTGSDGKVSLKESALLTGSHLLRPTSETDKVTNATRSLSVDFADSGVVKPSEEEAKKHFEFSGLVTQNVEPSEPTDHSSLVPQPLQTRVLEDPQDAVSIQRGVLATVPKDDAGRERQAFDEEKTLTAEEFNTAKCLLEEGPSNVTQPVAPSPPEDEIFMQPGRLETLQAAHDEAVAAFSALKLQANQEKAAVDNELAALRDHVSMLATTEAELRRENEVMARKFSQLQIAAEDRAAVGAERSQPEPPVGVLPIPMLTVGAYPVGATGPVPAASTTNNNIDRDDQRFDAVRNLTDEPSAQLAIKGQSPGPGGSVGLEGQIPGTTSAAPGIGFLGPLYEDASSRENKDIRIAEDLPHRNDSINGNHLSENDNVAEPVLKVFSGGLKERRPFQPISANNRIPSHRKVESESEKSQLIKPLRTRVINEGTQTLLSAKEIDSLVRGESARQIVAPPASRLEPAPSSPSRSSAAPENLALVTSSQENGYGSTSTDQLMPRASRSSGRNSLSREGGFRPPLPLDHREVIAAAAAAGSQTKGLMGPPAMPASAYKSYNVRGQSQGRGVTKDDRASRSRHRASTADSDIPHYSTSRTRQSSASSFASELDERFNIRNGGLQMPADFGPNTDPRMIQAITQTMIGEFLWKYTRKAGRGEMSENRHRRFFWVHPYTRTLYWSEQDPSQAGRTELKAKSVAIEAVRVVSDDNPMPPGLHRKSLVVVTPGRSIKFTAPTSQRHETWFNALSYLLLRTGPERSESLEHNGAGGLTQEDVSEFMPGGYGSGTRVTGRSRYSFMAGTSQRPDRSMSGDRLTTSGFSVWTSDTGRPTQPSLIPSLPPPPPSSHAGSIADRFSSIGSAWRSKSIRGSFSSMRGKVSEKADQQVSSHEPSARDSAGELRAVIERRERDADRLENVRACCDGRYFVGSSQFNRPN